MGPRHLWMLLAGGLCAIVVLGRLVGPWWGLLRPACTDLPLRSEPVQIRLVPGLEEHQSWVTFPVAGAPPEHSRWALCADGRLVGREPGYVGQDLVRFDIRTRFVDLLWLTGQVDAYRNSDRWELRYELPAQPPPQ